MKIFMIIVLPLCFIHPPVYAEKSCNEMWGAGTTNASACYSVREKEKLDKLMEEKLQLLVDQYLSIKMESRVEKLNASQKSWIEYRAAQCQLEESAFGGIGHVSTARCEKRMSSERIKTLEKLL
jgi:uncharacterized protein YecT (DUF1311 family)